MAAVRQQVGRDVFPALSVFITGGIIAGLIASVTISKVIEFHGGSLFIHKLLGAVLGAILGLFVGLSQGVWHSGETLRTPEPVSTLNWLRDPWLDGSRDDEENRPTIVEATPNQEDSSIQVDTIRCFPTEYARVRPRIISSITGEAIPLDDKIGQLIQEGRYKLIGVVEGAGLGKTTALQHLAATLPPWALAQVRLMNDPQGYADIISFGDRDGRFVISAGTK